MLLTDIASLVNQSTSNGLGPDQLLLCLDLAQKKAFQAEISGFVVRKDMTIYRVFTFLSSGYTDAIDSDIGKNVFSNSSHTNIGVLKYFDNDLRKWTVLTSSDTPFDDNLSIEDGTGDGNLNDAAPTGYKGPYYPTDLDPPMRKIWGVSVLTDNRLTHGYGNPKDSFQDAIYDEFDKSVLFNFTPSLTAAYRWVYWRNSVDLDSLDDDENLIIPPAFHDNYVSCAIMIANNILYKEPYTQDAINAFYKPFWDTLAVPHRIVKNNIDNRAAGTRQAPEVMI